MAWTTPRTWTAASALAAADLNVDVRDNTGYLKDALDTHGLTSATTPQPIKAGGYGVSISNASINVSDATDSHIQCDTEDWDDAGFHSLVTNTSRITIPTGGDGRYLFNGWVSFESNSSGIRQLWLEKNSATEYHRTRIPAITGAASSLVTSVELSLVAGDWVAMLVRQNSGGTLAVQGRLQARRISV